ncbi:MAG: fibronectin type III domain-containing protein [Oscillospiraceae bacterium]|nr:fibronectin type III domain-containing protein [Oscillospiraceae bacterium]
MKKLLAMLLAGLLLITSMSTVAWADDDSDDVSVDGTLPGLSFDSLSELWEYIEWLDEDYVSRADEMGFGDGVLEYLFYEMDGLYLPDGVEMDEVRIYVDPRYVDVTFKRDDHWLSLYYFVMGEDGESYTKRLVTMAKVSGIVTTLDNGTIVYYCLDAGTPCYTFVQDGVYYQLYDWSHSPYDESKLQYCNASYHSFGESYNLTAESADGKVKLSWDEIVEDSTYTVYWKRSSSDEWQVAGTTSKQKVGITGLKSGVSYDFKISGNGFESEVVTVIA